MKKLLISILVTLVTVSAHANPQFTPDMSLLNTWDQSWEQPDRISEHQPPYIAIFKKDGKTLIYLATRHHFEHTLDMVDYVYANFKPQITVVEFERINRMLRNRCCDNEFEYSIGISADKDIPFTLADLHDLDILNILVKTDPGIYNIHQARWTVDNALAHERQFGTSTTAEAEAFNFKQQVWKENMPEPMDAQELKNWFKKHFNIDFNKTNFTELFQEGWRSPSSAGTVFNKYSEKRDLLARDPFMLQNITAALNKYDTVYAAFGEGHYRCHRKVLEQMLGKPEYIWTVTNFANRSYQSFTDDNNRQSFRIKEEILVPFP